MLRWILQEIGLFGLPFLAFALFLLLTRRPVLAREHWDPQWSRLGFAGLFLVIASLVMTGLTAQRSDEGYVPPHMENGRLVPGRFQ